MAEIPNLAGVATKDLVDTIGTGRYQALYINWARTVNLLHEHAPGWMVDYERSSLDGSMIHPAPGVGAYLMIRFRHLDGTQTTAVPQAVMDNRNNPIPFDKISARDITDTQRRGLCMASAMIFGLAYELWAKMPMEEAYSRPVDDVTPESAPKTIGKANASSGAANAEAAKEFDQGQFKETCQKLGLKIPAISDIMEKIISKSKKNKVEPNWKQAYTYIAAKIDEDTDWVNKQNNFMPGHPQKV